MKMSSAANARINRIHIHERFKNNFNALHASFPHLTNQDDLDDSLTNLQWLQNLNVNPLNSIDTPGLTYCNKVNRKSYSSGNRRTNARTNHQFAKPINTPKQISLDELYGFSVNKNLNATKKLTLSLSTLETADVNTLLKMKNTLPEVDKTIEIDSNTPCTSSNSPLLSQASPQCTLSRPSAAKNLFFGHDASDYKTNQNAKPPHSYSYLIWTAMRSMRRSKITLTSIYKWVKDNFAYYRKAEFNWQAPLKHCLLTNKCFERVPKNKDDSTKSTYWRINPLYEDAIMKGFFQSKEGVSQNSLKIENGNYSSVFSSSTSSMSPFELIKNDGLLTSNVDPLESDFPSFGTSNNGRKRKQTFPLKVVKKKNKRMLSSSSFNLLQDQAPELGSLKGDYNWNSLLIDDFCESVTPETDRNHLPVQPRSKGGNQKTFKSPSNNLNISTDDFLSDVMLASDIADQLQHTDVPPTYGGAENDENVCSKQKMFRSDHQHQMTEEEVITSLSPCEWMQSNEDSIEDLTLSSIFGTSDKKNVFSGSSNVFSDDVTGNDDLSNPEYGRNSDESLDGFLKDVDSLDLTVTGKQIERPAEWVPIGMSLDSILCEKQDDNLELSYLGSNNTPSFSPNPSFMSPSPSSRSTKPRKPRVNKRNSDTNQPKTNQEKQDSNRSRYYSTFPNPNQELKSATDTIESLLAKDVCLDDF